MILYIINICTWQVVFGWFNLEALLTPKRPILFELNENSTQRTASRENLSPT